MAHNRTDDSVVSGAADMYRQTKIKTASQSRIIVMLYDEALRQIDIARNGIGSGEKRLDRINNALTKAHAIVTELMVALDLEQGGDFARNMFNLYLFFGKQIMEANVQKEREILDRIYPLISTLRDAWREVALKDQGDRSDPIPPQGLNISG